MKNISKEYFLRWLMYVIPISLCGLHFGIAWTVIQYLLYKEKIKEKEKKKIPLWEDPEIIKLNPDINLTEDYEGLVNVGNGIRIYQMKRKGSIKCE